jgi:hypothetical protein
MRVQLAKRKKDFAQWMISYSQKTAARFYAQKKRFSISLQSDPSHSIQIFKTKSHYREQKPQNNFHSRAKQKVILKKSITMRS